MGIVLHELVGADESRPFSPHCWKAVMSLAHKGMPFDRNMVSFTDIPKLENGYSAKLPMVRDGENVIADSFQIALYLEEQYPDLPSLFKGEGGRAMARFVEGYSQMLLHPFLNLVVLIPVYDLLDAPNKAYYIKSREQIFGRKLEDVAADRDEKRDTFTKNLAPIRKMLLSQPFIGGETPLFSDYIVFGAFQWVRVLTPYKLFDDGDPVADWFERCLDLHGGIARKVQPALV
ncbi:glutathione S-transferase family protein [Phyllobacterium sp. YR531]|uniref:glutathione S-transferase family protein n=1 Tax=Phyllobacterium sp. YR531 TaxID=1144343 RepID=UPI00026F5BE3|nr:glutathione S-transferase family protein [Phyllobacterium sp. YR531]EJM98755.1 glutathione S-transferase [Phyllobacterium sp. YR531]